VQQPIGQEFASQMHVPLTPSHSWPDGHPPQAAPFFPHEPVFWLP
jgi:hypothetical protein